MSVDGSSNSNSDSDSNVNEADREPLLVLGDVHGSDPERRARALETYERVDPAAVLQAGDLEYYDLPAPTWFVAGNNEDFEVIEALRNGERPSDVDVRNVHLLASAAADVGGLRVAGLSGNFAPTKYDLARSELEGDRRRHFTHEDVERAKALGSDEGSSAAADAGAKASSSASVSRSGRANANADVNADAGVNGPSIDVFLTHEAPTGLLSYGYDPGCEYVDDLLEALEPDLCLVGHHHTHREAETGDTRVVSLAPAWERYYTLEPETLTLEGHDLDRSD